jgi:hypothetical protein
MFTVYAETRLNMTWRIEMQNAKEEKGGQRAIFPIQAGQ